jgi:hypothetical protein
MKLNVKVPFTYVLDGTRHGYDLGEHDVPDAMAEVAMGAGWASPVETKAAAPAANKARKAAPENK